MNIRNLIILAIFALNSMTAVTMAQDSDVRVRNRVLEIETDDTEDAVEIHFENGAAIVHITHLPDGELSPGWGPLYWEPGEMTEEYLPYAEDYRFESEDLGDFDEIRVSTLAGNDVVLIHGSVNKAVTVYGAEGDDQLVSAGTLRNYLFGDDGEDFICIRDSDAFNVLVGGAGDDDIAGGDGRDYAYGGSGDDYIYTNGGNDVLYGQDGNDRLAGNDGFDYVSGGNGDDRLSGGNGYSDGVVDSLVGGSGSDTFIHRFYDLETVTHDYKYYERTRVFEKGRWVTKWVLRTRKVTTQERVYFETENAKDYQPGVDTLVERRDR